MEGPALRLLSSLRPALSQKWPAIHGNGGGPCPAPALLSQTGPKPEMACHRWKWRRALSCACSPLSGRPKAKNGRPSVELEEGPALRLLSSLRPAQSQKWPAIGGNGGGPCPAPALLSQAGPKPEMACHRWKWRRALPCACSPLSGRPQARKGLPSVEMEVGPCPAPAPLSWTGPKPEMACHRWKWRWGPALRLLSSLGPAPSQKWPAIGGNGGGPCLAPALLSQAGPEPEMACHL